MGMQYYYHPSGSPDGDDLDEIVIGIGSGEPDGLEFIFFADRSLGIETARQWQEFLMDKTIHDECGEVVALERLMAAANTPHCGFYLSPDENGESREYRDPDGFLFSVKPASTAYAREPFDSGAPA